MKFIIQVDSSTWVTGEHGLMSRTSTGGDIKSITVSNTKSDTVLFYRDTDGLPLTVERVLGIPQTKKANNTEKEYSICEKAVETFGVISQLDQAQEEAAELVVAISKYKRALESRDIDRIQLEKSKILMELADISIMRKQLMIILGYSQEDLRLAIICKMKKLLNYIKLGVK